LKGKISIVGCGGNGLLAAQVLSSMGFEQISVIDGDTISETDLGRQSLYSRNDLGFNKAETCRNKIEELNGLKNVVSYNFYLDSYNIEEILSGSDIVLDGTDSIRTRELINEYSVKKGIPWIMTASYGDMGQIKFIFPEKTSCLGCMINGRNLIPMNCHYDSVEPYAPQGVSVLSTSMIASFLSGKQVSGDLMFIEFGKMSVERIRIDINPGCSVCAGHEYPLLEDKKIKGRQIY
jgi:adenylyltransferase/sulfurtransferase